MGAKLGHGFSGIRLSPVQRCVMCYDSSGLDVVMQRPLAAGLNIAEVQQLHGMLQFS